MQDHIRSTEVAAVLTAYRVVNRVLLEALQAALERFEKSSGPLLTEAMALHLSNVKGEFLFLAAPDLPGEIQAVANSAFSRTFDSLSVEILNAYTAAFDRKP